MSWARAAIEALLRGEEPTLRYHGEAMRGRIDDGAEVTLAPVDPGELKVGDVVLARVKGEDDLHLIRAIDRGTFFVGDNVGGVGDGSRQPLFTESWSDKEWAYHVLLMPFTIGWSDEPDDPAPREAFIDEAHEGHVAATGVVGGVPFAGPDTLEKRGKYAAAFMVALLFTSFALVAGGESAQNNPAKYAKRSCS